MIARHMRNPCKASKSWGRRHVLTRAEPVRAPSSTVAPRDGLAEFQSSRKPVGKTSMLLGFKTVGERLARRHATNVTLLDGPTANRYTVPCARTPGTTAFSSSSSSSRLNLPAHDLRATTHLSHQHPLTPTELIQDGSHQGWCTSCGADIHLCHSLLLLRCHTRYAPRRSSRCQITNERQVSTHSLWSYYTTGTK
jgi:hypothetical protein